MANNALMRHNNSNQTEVNIKTTEKMVKLHGTLKNKEYTDHNIEAYLCRLIFCLFASGTDIFPQDNSIKNTNPDGTDLSDKLRQLLEKLNMLPKQENKQTKCTNFYY